MPKSIADIPLLSWSPGSILPEDKITAIKSEPLISCDEFINDVILSVIFDLNSSNEICFV